jgi:hypothetical protein
MTLSAGVSSVLYLILELVIFVKKQHLAVRPDEI